MYFATNLTLGIRTKDLHSIVRSRRPVVVPIECFRPTESPITATGYNERLTYSKSCQKSFRLRASLKEAATAHDDVIGRCELSRDLPGAAH